jgi:hypothetical protein
VEREPRVERRAPVLRARVRGQSGSRNAAACVGWQSSHAANEIEAALARHPDVRDEDVGHLARQALDGLLDTRGRGHSRPRRWQHVVKQVPHVFVVLDEEDADAVDASRA